MLTAEEVLNSRFRSTRFRDGYDQDEVDGFLDRVVDTLNGKPGVDPVTVEQVQAVRFTATKFRDGYDQDEVDDFLDRVVEALRDLPRAPRLVPVVQVAHGGPPPLGEDALSGSELITRLQLARAVQVSTAPDTVLIRLPDGTVSGALDVRVTALGLEIVTG
ncbi:MAG: DivIVA domain-containing protein [Actinobacteria bacterium]|nr:DivIVA domain-containing protein [Actinomycetota bacterium]